MGNRLKLKWQDSVQFRLALMTLIAFTIWSGWATFANWNHGMGVAVISGLAQGSQSALSTFFGSAFIEWLFDKFKYNKWSVVIVGAISSCSSFLFMFSVHTLLATPELVLTLAPVTTLATFYCFSYTYSLNQATYVR